MICHPDLAHAGAPNFGYDIRKMLYFRIKAKCCSSGACVRGCKSSECLYKVNAAEEPTSARTINAAAAAAAWPESSGERCVLWSEVEEKHRSDMWVDIPAASALLGGKELPRKYGY